MDGEEKKIEDKKTERLEAGDLTFFATIAKRKIRKLEPEYYPKLNPSAVLSIHYFDTTRLLELRNRTFDSAFHRSTT